MHFIVFYRVLMIKSIMNFNILSFSVLFYFILFYSIFQFYPVSNYFLFVTFLYNYYFTILSYSAILFLTSLFNSIAMLCLKQCWLNTLKLRERDWVSERAWRPSWREMNTVGEHKNKMSPEEEEYMKEFTSDRAALLSFPDIDGTLHTEREKERGACLCLWSECVCWTEAFLWCLCLWLCVCVCLCSERVVLLNAHFSLPLSLSCTFQVTHPPMASRFQYGPPGTVVTHIPSELRSWRAVAFFSRLHHQLPRLLSHFYRRLLFETPPPPPPPSLFCLTLSSWKFHDPAEW